MTVVHIDSLGGINYHRLIVPLMRLKAQGFDDLFFIKSLSELKDMKLDRVDNLLISRKLSVTNHKEFRKMLDQNGITLILDNDDYWKLNPDNPAYALYETYYGPDIRKTIKISDVIWTPNAYLGRQMKHINPMAKIEFVNNAIDETEAQWSSKEKSKSKNLRFGYMGASSHTEDIKIMQYSFEGKNLSCMDGMDYEGILSANTTFPPRNIFEYAKNYKNIDVSIAPLKRNKFNRCKSDLKITEAAMTKTAIIASDVENYRFSVIHNETGILCSTPEEWKDAIESMTKQKAKMLGENLYESLKDDPFHNLDKINEVRLKYLTK